MSTDIEGTLTGWITDAMEGVPVTVRPDSPLIADRLLDSLQLMSLIEFAEETFKIRLDEADMHPVNFETINAIAALVRRKKVTT